MPLPGLTPQQQSHVDRWLPHAELVADMSWPERLTTVLWVRAASEDLVIKAPSPVMRAHTEREIAAHRSLGPLGPRFPELRFASEADHLLVLSFVPGQLVEGTHAAADPSVYCQAGRLLAHLQSLGSPDGERGTQYVAARHKTIAQRLARAAPLLGRDLFRRAQSAHTAGTPAHEPAVPCHGDMTPRNWVVSPEGVALIDLGRFAWRPWYSDAVRLWGALPDGDPRLTAYLDGIGRGEPWREAGWRDELLMQAISTVVWATDVGQPDFADDGRRMLERALG
ncbi:aminoglycoside phosphotransferase family protein [Serinibacter salmoneus]|uniref:Phosphotransferase family enzyme n=1 Tax=Serinibacter salmoneus TaxID=556530 RepID=A0A2A9D2F7_9MICO|nr:aminoglycoside phosphotransferase family protein [Serinibacter salmoneus]PFG20854.1 phosphotransferase family enzyme [Serinibacter salmoneus]